MGQPCEFQVTGSPRLSRSGQSRGRGETGSPSCPLPPTPPRRKSSCFERGREEQRARPVLSAAAAEAAGGAGRESTAIDINVGRGMARNLSAPAMLGKKHVKCGSGLANTCVGAGGGWGAHRLCLCLTATVVLHGASRNLQRQPEIHRVDP
jgi:hypothetical protein